MRVYGRIDCFITRIKVVLVNPLRGYLQKYAFIAMESSMIRTLKGLTDDQEGYTRVYIIMFSDFSDRGTRGLFGDRPVLQGFPLKKSNVFFIFSRLEFFHFFTRSTGQPSALG